MLDFGDECGIMVIEVNAMHKGVNMNRAIEVLVSTFNDGVNNMYNTVTIDRWYDEKHDDYVFTFNGQVEHLSDNASFVSIIRRVYGEKLLDFKIKRDVTGKLLL